MPILTDEERAGTTIAGGKYTIEHVLGRGGMGTVFAGVHNWTGRPVAIKLLRHDLASNEEAARRYLQEARATTAIEHPNVVDVLDMGRDGDGSIYLVFERLSGESLADWLERAGRLTVYELAETLLPVLDALSIAHRLGIVHRDLKPENIYLADDGRGGRIPKLLDFGIAKIDDEMTRTATGQVVGTPVYMSPEQAQGRRDTGPASDVWSMGVVLFECLTGYPPFESTNTTGVLLAIVSHPIPSLRECRYVPEAVADVVERALTRDVAERLPDAGALRDALANASGVEFVPSRNKTLPPRVIRIPTAQSESPTLDRVVPLDAPPSPAAPSDAIALPPTRRRPTSETDPALPLVTRVQPVTRRALPATVLAGVALALALGFALVSGEGSRATGRPEPRSWVPPREPMAQTPPTTEPLPLDPAATSPGATTPTATTVPPEPAQDRATARRRSRATQPEPSRPSAAPTSTPPLPRAPRGANEAPILD